MCAFVSAGPARQTRKGPDKLNTIVLLLERAFSHLPAKLGLVY
jgi:hypothetical protein